MLLNNSNSNRMLHQQHFFDYTPQHADYTSSLCITFASLVTDLLCTSSFQQANNWRHCSTTDNGIINKHNTLVDNIWHHNSKFQVHCFAAKGRLDKRSTNVAVLVKHFFVWKLWLHTQPHRHIIDHVNITVTQNHLISEWINLGWLLQTGCPSNSIRATKVYTLTNYSFTTAHGISTQVVID